MMRDMEVGPGNPDLGLVCHDGPIDRKVKLLQDVKYSCCGLDIFLVVATILIRMKLYCTSLPL